MTSLSEFQLIDRIRSLVGTGEGAMLGIGDDCAVLPNPGGDPWLVTTDCLVEGVHFNLNWTSLAQLGRKALAVNLSDIAAMGCVPKAAFVTLAIPPAIPSDDVLDFYRGMKSIADEYGVTIAGGDTSASPDKLFISVTLTGTAPGGRYLLRVGAKPGDGIYVSGHPGYSALGLALLRAGEPGCPPQGHPQEGHPQGVPLRACIAAHLDPKPRVVLGRILAATAGVHALIDVSDGLVQDLGHICQASGVTAEIDVALLSQPEGFPEDCRRAGLDPELASLVGGEDYELLFTMDDAAMTQLKKTMTHDCPPMTRIGQIMTQAGASNVDPVRVMRAGKTLDMRCKGYEHFYIQR